MIDRQDITLSTGANVRKSTSSAAIPRNEASSSSTASLPPRTRSTRLVVGRKTAAASKRA